MTSAPRSSNVRTQRTRMLDAYISSCYSSWDAWIEDVEQNEDTEQGWGIGSEQKSKWSGQDRRSD